MNNMNYKKILYLLVMTGIMSCNNNNKTTDNSNQQESETTNVQEPFAPYEILKTEPYETSNKAQIKSYAYLTTDTISKENLSGTLTKIYGTVQDYSSFKNFSSPTVIAIYLFTSKDKAASMPESWIAMLSKTPSDNQPKISFNDWQLEALEGLTDNEKSADEKKYDELNDYLKKRNTDLCFIYKTLYDLEGPTIKQADIKFPDFGIEHSEYQSKLYKQEKKKLFNKYNINDTLSTSITVFGMNYCK